MIDREGKPVKGASVTFRVYMGGGDFKGAKTYTATTGADGTANAPLTLGKYTKDNPYYMNINTDDEYLGMEWCQEWNGNGMVSGLDT